MGDMVVMWYSVYWYHRLWFSINGYSTGIIGYGLVLMATVLVS